MCRRMTPKTFLRSMLVAGALVTSAGHPARAQDGISARIKEASRAFALAHAPTGRLDEQQQERVVEFVAGNALFTLGHELGHAVVREFNLPVLGREEERSTRSTRSQRSLCFMSAPTSRTAFWSTPPMASC